MLIVFVGGGVLSPYKLENMDQNTTEMCIYMTLLESENNKKQTWNGFVPIPVLTNSKIADLHLDCKFIFKFDKVY